MKKPAKRKLRVLLLGRSLTALGQIERMLQSMSRCEIERYDNVLSALESISRSVPDIIITGWNLRDLTAQEFLGIIKGRKEWGEIPILVYAAEDDNGIREQAMELGATDVLYAPLDQNILRQRLIDLFPVDKQVEVSSRKSIELKILSKIKSIEKLAPLPKLVQAIFEVTGDPNSSARQLADLIKKDQALTAKILKIVNSAYYGFHREIANVDHATVVLGFEEIKSIALAASIIQIFGTGKGDFFNRHRFWVHALGAAYIARALRKQMKEIIPQDAFVIGLLHDFGKVVLHQHFPDLFKKALKTAAKRQAPLHEVMREYSDSDHAEIGGMVAESWGLPKQLIMGIRHHHNPSSAYRHECSIHLAHLSNYFCHKHHIGESGNPVPDEPYIGSLEAFGIDNQDLDEVWNSMEIDIESIQSII